MARKSGDAVRGEPAGFHEALEADQERIAGECRKGRIRRAAVAGGVQGENLPKALLGGREKIDETVGRRAEVSNAAVGRQGRNVQQHTTHPLLIHL